MIFGHFCKKRALLLVFVIVRRCSANDNPKGVFPLLLCKTRNAFELKLFMALLMVLDHLDHIPGLLWPETAALFHALSRCVGVWFAYMAVEGFVHTRSRPRYTLRLLGWGVVMALGDRLYNMLGAPYGLSMSNNIFLTLGVGVAILDLLAGTDPRHPPTGTINKLLRTAGAAVLLAAGILFTEGGIVILPFLLLAYRFRGRPLPFVLSCLGLSALLFALTFHAYPTLWETLLMLGFNSDFLFITVLPFLALYNGQRGPSGPFAKYFFYLFYPAHLWVIGLIALRCA